MDVFVILTSSFEKWMTTLGYARSTVYLSTHYVRDFFFYLKSFDITHLEQIDGGTINSYYRHLLTRHHKRQTGGLSHNYITSNINALKRLSRYLEQTGQGHLDITLKATTEKDTYKTILTREEIKAMYQVCDSDVFGIRDKALLSIYYGCGLRRSEGILLDVKDVMIKEKLVYVRGGKGYKERYVPMTEAIKEDLETYLYQSRETLIKGLNKNEEAFLISYRAKRMDGNTIMLRIKTLAKRAGITKPIGIHTLRHCIATHLLQSGLTLEEVSQFLGHSSLGSTQIYTHLVHE
jgi:integrase/recombinase XerD